MRNITTFIYPTITLGIIVLLWYLVVWWFAIPKYVLPPPVAVAATLADVFINGTIWPDIWYTIQSTLIGYAIGCTSAVLLGAILAESPTLEKFLYPFVVGIQAMPKVALAPLLLVWFGFGLESKIALVILICFFPLFVNTVAGFRQTDRDLIDMCRVSTASRWYIFLHVKLPSAANNIFAGLQIGVALALIGAVVGEFVASTQGLGYMVASASQNMSVSTMFAGIIVLAILGVAGTQLVRMLHRVVVFWEARSDNDTLTH